MKKILLICLCILCLVGYDYTSKRIAKNALKDLSVYSYLGGSIQFVYAENTGGMLSTGSKLPDKTRPIIYKYFVSLMLVLLFVFTIFKKGIIKWKTIALVLILSGGIGNLIDRFTNDGKVIDFIIISIFNYSTGIFNIADTYITVGVVLILISSFLNKYHKVESIG
jgi:signal peptidase II